MPKKNHKLHRHRDKHSSKIRTHGKLKKEHVVSQAQLEPIQEVSKEKLRFDKNACGDYLHSSALRTQLEDDKAKKQKYSRSSKDKTGEDLVNKDNSKGEEISAPEKSVRHHSLEKNENSLFSKTKYLFRKEKSFNDAITKAVVDSKDDKIEKDDPKRERKHRHHRKETVSDDNEDPKANNEGTIIGPIAKNDPNEVSQNKPHSSHNIKRKREKSHKRKHRSTDKSPQQPFNRVQEVIFCQTNQVPYKMKNDRSASEVKDLFRRIKGERRRLEERREGVKHRSHSRADSKRSYGSKPERHFESYFASAQHQIGANDGQKKERFKGPEQQQHLDQRGKSHKERHIEKTEKNAPTRQQYRNNDLSEISLGPYENYFTFEKRYHNEHCKKYHRKQLPTKSVDRRYQNNPQENSYTEDSHKRRQKSQEKGELKKESAKVEEDKIHQIVEGDLKNYFHKIQAMIDKKLDAILQINREKREERKKEKEQRESRKRSKSKPKEASAKCNIDHNKDSEGKKKHKPSERKDKGLNKEEIINEVLKRLKEETLQKYQREQERKLQSKTSKVEVSKSKRTGEEGHIRNDNSSTIIDPLRYANKKSNSDNLVESCETLNGKVIECPHMSRRSRERQPSTVSGSQGLTRCHRHKEHYENKDLKRGKTSHVEPLSDKLQLMAKDSLEYMRHRSNPPPELVIPFEDICCIAEKNSSKLKRRHRSPHAQALSRKEEKMVLPSTSKPYDSTSSCKTRENEISRHRHYRHLYSASDETVLVNYRQARIRKSLSPARYIERVDIANEQLSKRGREEEELINKRMKTAKDKHEYFIQDPCQKYLSTSPPRHNIPTQQPFLEEIFLPPHNFRQPHDVLYNEQTSQKEDTCPQGHQFIVQGIEPPILECAMKAPRRNTRVRKLECKTVSIIGIPPQIILKGLPIVNETQTSSKSRKSSITDRDLVEKKKNSKRFKLYYKYSIIDNAQEHNDDSSDAKSIVSDSYRVVSDPSDECVACKGYKKEKRPRMDSNGPQVTHNLPKKWNRVSTPRDSHLNNIIEEPSNMSTSLKEQDYFVPLHGTKEYYCRVLSSSHSEYCFKIDKKPANSNISLQSRDNWDGRYIIYEGRKCRYYRPDMRSRSDCKLVSKMEGNVVFSSRSDMFLDASKGKQVLRSIFLEDTHPFVRNKNFKAPPNRVGDLKPTMKQVCKNCLTSEVKPYDEVVTPEEDALEVFENKQEQFAQIYKTIDNLEKNIHSSNRVPPKMVDTAVSSAFLSARGDNKKKPQTETIFRAGGRFKNAVVQTCEEVPVKKINAVVGSPVKSRRNDRPKTRLAEKQIHDVAVGDSEVKMPEHSKTPRSKFQKAESRDIKNRMSTAVSPPRIVEEVVTQIPPKSLPRKATKPQTPKTKQFVPKLTGLRTSKNTPENSPIRSSGSRAVETKKEQLTHQAVTIKDTHPKSAARPRQQSNEDPQRASNYSQKASPLIKVFRSAERSPNLKRQVSYIQDNLGTRAISGVPKEMETPQYENNTRRNVSNKRSGYAVRQELKKTSSPIIVAKEDAYPVGDVINNSANEDKPAKKYVPQTPLDNATEPCFLHSPPKEFPEPIGTGKSTLISSDNNKPIVANTAAYNNRQPSAQPKVRKTESSTSSSVSGIAPRIIRKSKSLVEMRSHKSDLSRSKSDLCCFQRAFLVRKDDYLGTKDGSMISNNMEKFANQPNLRCSGSKSHGTSLDHYMGNKFISRLFLTKDYKGAAISAYQKRKLYDQSIRQKMKKNKFKFSKIDVGPQIFEVRFLSMINQEDHNKQKDYKSLASNETPVLSLNLGKIPQNSIHRKRQGFKPNNPVDNSKTLVNKWLDPNSKAVIDEDTDNLKVKERNLIFDSANHIAAKNELNDITISTSAEATYEDHRNFTGTDTHIRQEKLLTFVKKIIDMNSIFNEEMFKNTECACKSFSEDCSACKNFISLMSRLHASLAKYCSSRAKLEPFIDNNSSELEEYEVYLRNNHGIIEDSNTFIEKVEAKYALDLSLPIATQPLKVEELFPVSHNKISVSDSTQSTEPSRHHFNNPGECLSLARVQEIQEIELPMLLQPMSCPVLATNCSSFEFLYEEASGSNNENTSHESIIANLTRPFDQTFNFSTSQYNVETPFFRENWESASSSIESGYASIKSKNCCANSFTNFFKKPSIIALFKPPSLTSKKSDLIKIDQQLGEKNLVRSIIYKEMTKKCQLYAKKVRQRSEMKLGENVDEYQEFSLKLLLGKDSSVVLESKKLSLRSIGSDLDDSAKDAQDAQEIDTNPLDIDEDTSELSAAVASLENVTKASKIFSNENGCKLILSNHRLNIDYIICFGPDIFTVDYKAVNVKSEYSNASFADTSAQESSFSLDFSLDSNNPFVSNNDSTTHKFLTSLIKLYEREAEICDQLYNDEQFENALLSAVRTHKMERKKNKKGIFCRLFRKKQADVQGYVGKNYFQNLEDLERKSTTRLQTLASNARKCFTMLADAVKVNGNIDKEIKICGLLRLLERIENSDFKLMENDEHGNLEEELQSQIKHAFVNIHDLCQMEAKKCKRRITHKETMLLKSFVTRHRIGLLSESDIVVSYVGRGIIHTEDQLRAAVRFLIRSRSDEVNVKEFEEYCKFAKP